MCGDPKANTDTTIGRDIDAYIDTLPDDLKAELKKQQTDSSLVELNKKFQAATGLDEVSSQGALHYALLRSHGTLDDSGFETDTMQKTPMSDVAKRVFRDALANKKKDADALTAVAAPDKTDLYLRNTGLKRATGSQFGSFLGGY